MVRWLATLLASAGCGRIGFDSFGDGMQAAGERCETVTVLDISAAQNQYAGSFAGHGDDYRGSGECGNDATNIDVVYRFDVTSPAGRTFRIRVTSDELTGLWFAGTGCPTADVFACAEIHANPVAIDHFYGEGTYHLLVERTSSSGASFEIFIDQL
jgi:hypothetical protein